MKIIITTANGTKVETHINGNMAIVGRSRKCDVVFKDEALSRQHCKIELEKDSFFITDLNSANGVFIDGERILPNSKTPFANFSQLFFGPLECAIEGWPEKEIILPSNRQKPERVKKIEAVKKSVSNKTKSKFEIKILLLPSLILIFAVYYFRSGADMNQVSAGPSVASQSIQKKAPYQLQKVEPTPNSFKSMALYQDMLKKKNCSAYQEICSGLNLSEDKHEGVYTEGKESFLYINPHPHLEQKTYAGIKDNPRAADLFAFRLLLASSYFNKFIFKEVLQIHLVLMNPSGTLSKVYRFNTQLYELHKIDRIEILTRLTNAVQGDMTEEFWKQLEQTFPVKELKE